MSIGGAACSDDPATSVAVASTTVATTTVATTTTSPFGLPGSVDTVVGTWTLGDTSAGIPTTLPPYSSHDGPPDDMGGALAVYTIGGSDLALKATVPDAGIDDEVFLAVWRRDDAGVWERVATGPAMPAYRMRWSALIDVEPAMRSDELIVVDAAGGLLTIDPTGSISETPAPPISVPPPNTRDGVASIATTDDALLVLTGPDSAAMWRDGWPEWRTFSLPGDASATDLGVTMGQVRTDGGEFLVDVLVAGPSFVTWRLTEPVD